MINYKAVQSIILEDKFGVDHQFLKGHSYTIEANNIEKYITIRGVNIIQCIPKKAYFLTKEQVEKYFKEINFEPAVGSRGNPKTIRWSKPIKNKDD